MTTVTLSQHLVLACVRSVNAALTDVAGVEPTFMSTPDKAAALLDLSELIDRIGELRLRVLAAADDVAEADGSRDTAAWLTHHHRLDGAETRRLRRLAADLDQRHTRIRDGLREGRVNLDQAAVINQAMNQLPADLDTEIRDLAEAHLVEQAANFDPHHLRILGRRVLDVIAPEISDDQERDALDRTPGATATAPPTSAPVSPTRSPHD